MSTITIIGTGNMARGIATRALAAGRTVEILGRDEAKAQALAAELDGAGTTSGSRCRRLPPATSWCWPCPSTRPRTSSPPTAPALAGKTVVDITNPVNFETFDSLVVAPGTLRRRGNRGADPRQRGQGLQHHVRRSARGR